MKLKCKQTIITIGRGELNVSINHLFDHPSSIYLIDANVADLYPQLVKGLKHIVIPSGELSKSLTEVEKVILQLLEMGADRSSMLVGIGGGVTCDLTGFVASTFMRGIPFGFVPTTLLAQVDAAIGGKNGVNIGPYKNTIGTINQPSFIWVNVNFIRTLPRQELISGMAEVVKHACIGSHSYFEFLEESYQRILDVELEIIETIIVESINIKIAVVDDDERENGIRKILNYCQSYGHAIETHYKIPHGYAVSLGIVFANEIGTERLGLNLESDLRIQTLLANVGLPINTSHVNKEMLLERMSKDKKKTGNVLDMILLKEIGKPLIIPIKLSQL